jgi:hypothetical protein
MLEVHAGKIRKMSISAGKIPALFKTSESAGSIPALLPKLEVPEKFQHFCLSWKCRKNSSTFENIPLKKSEKCRKYSSTFAHAGSARKKSTL